MISMIIVDFLFLDPYIRDNRMAIKVCFRQLFIRKIWIKNENENFNVNSNILKIQMK